MERAFLYGDLLFETMLAEGGIIAHISRHYSRLSQSAEVLKIALCGLNEEKFNALCAQKIAEFEQKNPDSIYLRVRAVLNRDSEGTYLPQNNIGKLSIQISEIEKLVQTEILRLGIYKEQQKAPGILANLKSGNALIYVMASIWAQENNLNGALILNTQNNIIESSHSNIFWRQGTNWLTPPLADGCVAGIGRELFMETNKVLEKSCSRIDLLNADECILTNALNKPRNFTLIDSI
jgi:branched-chain amino acid aminotransferase